MNKSFKNNFHPYAALTILFWSLAYVLTRLLLEYFTPFSLGFLRYLIASITLAVIAVRRKMKLPQPSELPWFFAAGSTGFFLYMIAFNQGQSMVTVSTASIVIATVPVLTAILARFIYREQLCPIQWFAVLVEFAGVTVLTFLHGNDSFSVNTGLFWLFLAAFLLSVYNLLQRKLTQTCSAFQASVLSIFCGTFLLTLFAPDAITEAAGASALSCFYLAILGICSSAIAYVSWSKALSLAKQTSQVSNYMFFTPLLTCLLGFLMIGELPDQATLLGGGIILLGMCIFHLGAKKKELS